MERLSAQSPPLPTCGTPDRPQFAHFLRRFARRPPRYPAPMRFLLSIRVRLVVVLLAAALAPLAAVLVLSKRIVDQSVERSALATISAIAEGKSAQLDAYGRERLRQVAGIATGVAFVNAAQELPAAYPASGARDESAYAAAVERFRPRLDSWLQTNGLSSFQLADRDGRVVFSTDTSPLLNRTLLDRSEAARPVARAMAAARDRKAPALSKPGVAGDGVRPRLEIVGPILRDGGIAGYAIVALDPAEIDRIVLDATGLGKTGEIVCATGVGGEIVLTTPTRANPDAAYAVHADLGSDFAKNLQGSVYGSPSRGRGEDTAGHPAIGAWTRVESLGWAIGVTQHVDEIFAAAAAQERAILSIAGIAVVPVVLVALFVAGSIGRPIERAADTARAIADGDLSADVRVFGAGEPRALLEAMRRSVAGLVALLRRVQAAGGSLGESARVLRGAAREQDETTQTLRASGAQIATAVRQIGAAHEELVRSMHVVERAVRAANGSAAEGRVALARLSDEIDAVRSGAGNVSARLDAIRTGAEHLAGVVAGMAKVANQTNLLSVNAAMEAERAGDAGAGFRAVAVEIRRLATLTADATLAIERIVAEMQSAVAAGVEDMASHAKGVEGGTASIAALGDRFGSVIGGVEQLGGEVERVARGVDAQAIGIAEVSRALAALSDGAARTADAATRFIETSAALERRAEGLAREAGAFRLPASG